jgi:NitT/TauT family transport system ATP-binding protein
MTSISPPQTGTTLTTLTKGTLPGVARIPAGHEPSRIELVGVTKRLASPAGTALTALRDVDFVVEPGQFCAVVGPTWCGKSTTLTWCPDSNDPALGWCG